MPSHQYRFAIDDRDPANPEGEELPDDEAARQRAETIAAEFCRVGVSGKRLVVFDETNRLVCEIPLSRKSRAAPQQ
jgi:hypothetical protein